MPSSLNLTMSSGGRIFVNWNEVSDATAYEFKATFDAQEVIVSGQVPQSNNLQAAAIATFLIAPDATDKQGKQVCLAVRAVNNSGSSDYTGLGCTSFKYYDLTTLSRAKSELPQITIHR